MAYKVVVADGSPSVQKAAELALPGPEFEIFPFVDGLEAINAIPGLRPDAVLSGLSLPSKDGYELASFVRSQESGRQIALFFLRGTFEPLDLQKIGQTQNDGIIVEPFDGATLAGLVREAIDRKKELPSIPEESALESVVLPGPPPDAPIPADGTADLEKRVRDLVKEEIRNGRAEWESMAREVISAEFKKMLVDELKGIDTRKI
jgi:CheY-like chemotaxis protein